MKRLAFLLIGGVSVLMCPDLYEAAKEVLPLLSDHAGYEITTMEYRTPADELRRAADRMDREAAAKQRLRKAVEDCENQMRGMTEAGK